MKIKVVEIKGKDGKEYWVSLEEWGHVKRESFLLANRKRDGLTFGLNDELNFTPYFEVATYSANPASAIAPIAQIYLRSLEKGEEVFGIILGEIKARGLDGVINYIENINVDECTEFGRLHF